MMFALNRHRRYRDNVSAYIDGQLTSKETKALEAHLDSCDACRRDLDDLRAVAVAVRELPQAHAPRSFALTPEQARRSAASTPRASVPPLAVGMRLAGATLAFTLALVFVADVTDVHVHFGSNDEKRGGAPLSVPQLEEAARKLANTQAQQAPSPSSGFNAFDSTKTQATGSDNRAGGAPTPGATAAAAAPTPTPAEEALPRTEGSGGAGTGAQAGQSPGSPVPTPAPDAVKALQELERTATEQLAQNAGAYQSRDHGLSAIRVAEIVLGAALGAVLIAGVAAAVLRRRSGRR